MSCRFPSPKQAPLSFPLHTFNPSHINDFASRLDRLAQMGFGVITIQPTYKAVTSQVGTGTDQFRRVTDFDVTIAPSFQQLYDVGKAIIDRGLHLRIVPQIDPDVLLDGTEKQMWRGFLVFDPMTTGTHGYYDSIIKPMMTQVLVPLGSHRSTAYPNCLSCMSLTLGSELEASLVSFPDKWEVLRSSVVALRPQNLQSRLGFGHKVNHDHRTAVQTGDPYDRWISHIRAYGQQVNDAGLRGRQATPQWSSAQTYLSRLDYLSFSFYVDALRHSGLTLDQWKAPLNDANRDRIASGFDQAYQGMTAGFAGLNPKPPFEIGEMGIGKGDPSRPNDFDNGAVWTSAAARNIRRNFYAGLLKFLSDQKAKFAQSNACLTYRPATFWTVGAYDFAGSHSQTLQHIDQNVVSLVRRYNQVTSPPPAAPASGGGSGPAPSGSSGAGSDPGGSSGSGSGGDSSGGKEDKPAEEKKPCLFSFWMQTEVAELHRLRLTRERLRKFAAGRALVQTYYRLAPSLVRISTHVPRRMRARTAMAVRAIAMRTSATFY